MLAIFASKPYFAPMNSKHRKTLAAVFTDPVSGTTEWTAVESLLLAAGAGSVWYWAYTESIGAGDLRPYALVQFLPMVLILLMVALFPSPAGGTRYLLWCLGWYLAAKGLEHFDAEVFVLAGGALSGHSLKHVAAAAGVACLLPYAKLRLERQPVDV